MGLLVHGLPPINISSVFLMFCQSRSWFYGAHPNFRQTQIIYFHSTKIWLCPQIYVGLNTIIYGDLTYYYSIFYRVKLIIPLISSPISWDHPRHLTFFQCDDLVGAGATLPWGDVLLPETVEFANEKWTPCKSRGIIPRYNGISLDQLGACLQFMSVAVCTHGAHGN